MKKFIKYLAFLALGGLFFSSCEDDYSEEDALNALQYVTLQVSVHDAGDSYSAIQGAEVKAVVNAETVTATTDTNGIAIFEDVQIGGDVYVYVSKDDYTTVYTSVNTTPDDYRQTAVTGNVYLYALSGDNIATFTGQLTAETDLTDRDREYVSGVEVMAYNGSLSGTTNYFVGTTDSVGTYSISVPVNSTGSDNVYIYFPDYEAERTYGESINNVYSLETKTFDYYPNSYTPTAVDIVPSALIEIAAPPASGSGFELSTKMIRTSLSAAVDNEYTDEAIVTGGSGYTAGQSFTFAADDDGNQAQLYISSVDANGAITDIYITDNGATYSSMPAIASNPADGSGAEFDLRYRYSFKVYISNYGSGYLTFPTVGRSYETSVDNTTKLQSRWDESYSTYTSYAMLVDGKIRVSDETMGDTLYSVSYVYSDYEFTYSDEDREQAVWYAYYSGISTTDSSLSDYFYSKSYGDGYDYSDLPEVTITALAGYGSGASVKVYVNTSGQVTDLIVMAEGTGYTQDINDYDGDGTYSEVDYGSLSGFDYSYMYNSYGAHYDVRPGATYTGDAYYGTGVEATE